MLTRIGALLLLLVAMAAMAQAQPGRHCNHFLFGVVTDSETLEPLPYARIQVVGQDRGALTGMNGEYRINDLCDGPIELHISHIGCEDIHVQVTIRENTHHDITLPHSHSHTDSVLIEDKHPDPKPMTQEATLSGRELKSVAGKSLGEALMRISGVHALQTGPSIWKPMIHGLHGNRILILNNGIRQEGQQWGTEHGPEIDPFIATRLTVLKGAGGVRYGSDAIAGVVLVEPAPLPDTAGISGSASLVGVSNGRGGAASAQLQGSFKWLPAFAWRVQGTVRRLGDQRSPAYVLSNTGLREYNYSAAAAWRKKRWGVELFQSQFTTGLGILAAAHIGNLTDLEAAIGADTPLVVRPFTYAIGAPRQEVLHELTKVQAWFHPGEHSAIRLTAARQYNSREEYDIRRNASDAPGLSYQITTHSTELMFEHNKWRGLRGMAGISGQYQANTYGGAFLIPDYRAYAAGAYLIERFVRLRWELEAGLRYDLRELHAYLPNTTGTTDGRWQNASITVGGLYRISAHVNANLNVGTAWRPPAVNELYSRGLHHGSASFEIGDPDLQREQALNTIAGIRYQGHERFSGELTLYHNRVRDFIYLQPVEPPTLTIRGAFPTFEYRQADVTLTGADGTFAWMPLHGLRWEMRASVLRARNLKTQGHLIWMPADRLENTFRYTLDGGKRLVEPYFGITPVLVRRQHRTDSVSDYLPPPPGYFRLDAELGVQIILGGNPLDVQISAQNLLNAHYRDYLDRFRYFADAPGTNVVLRLTYPFQVSQTSQSHKKVLHHESH